MRVAGKIHCQAHSRPAFEYFRASAVGKTTAAGSDPEIIRVLGADAREVVDEVGLDDGRQRRIVTRSLSPLPARTTIWLASRSTSWTRSRQRSSTRSPAP